MNLVLFINGNLGIRILKYFTELKDHRVVLIILNSKEKQTLGYMDKVESILVKKQLNIPILIWKNDFSLIENEGINVDLPTFGVSALFGHVLPEEIIKKFSGGILNLHASLLPIGRGADPIPWSVVNKLAQGISLHLIDSQLDSGDIIFQKEISTSIDMSAGDIYEIAMKELMSEFEINFPKWIEGQLIPKQQKTLDISLNKSKDMKRLQIIDENQVGTFGDFVRQIQATTFSDGRRPLFKDSMGKIWEISFRISHHNVNTSKENN